MRESGRILRNLEAVRQVQPSPITEGKEAPAVEGSEEAQALQAQMQRDRKLGEWEGLGKKVREEQEAGSLIWNQAQR